MLLNVAIFVWLGAVCPWTLLANNSVIPIYRLIPLGLLILLLRRLPIVFAMHKWIHQIQEVRQALFVGFFGPIGISAVFYLYITLEFLRGIEINGVQRADAAVLSEVTTVVVWVSHHLQYCKLSTRWHRIFLLSRWFTAYAYRWAKLASTCRAQSLPQSPLRKNQKSAPVRRLSKPNKMATCPLLPCVDGRSHKIFRQQYRGLFGVLPKLFREI